MSNKTGVIIGITGTCLLVIGLLYGGYLVYTNYNRVTVPEPIIPEESESELILSEPEPEESKLELHIPYFEVGKFGPDPERKAYVSGEMTLIVPRMDFEGPVFSDPPEDFEKTVENGVNDETLKEGVALFKQAQLPGPENRNVSIAGHRDIYGKEFYDIDKITDGDYIYLIYNGQKYIYEYENTLITHDRDWDPIRTKDYSCVTLQSCTPVNIATERIFVIGKLVDIVEAE